MSVKKAIQENANVAAHINTAITVVGIVTSSDESNNTCSVLYTDKRGIMSNRSNVGVRLYGNGTDWFPDVGDAVVIEDTGDTVVIIARHVGNYAMAVRSRRQLRQDIHSDDSGCQPPGGQIM